MTLFMTLLACFQALLCRYSGQEDIGVGTFIANRTRAETEALIGFFVNNLVLRTDLSGDPSFVELLQRVKEVTVGAYENQDVPFEKILEELRPNRDLSRTPLYQVMLVLQNIHGYEAIELGQGIGHITMRNQRSNFDLTLRMTQRGESLAGELEYNIQLFDASTIERMHGHLLRLLEGVLDNPEQRLSELPLLTDGEREQLTREWNDTVRDDAVAGSECLHQLFEAQAERTPEAIAVVAENEQLSYRELNRRANQLAHYLRSAGVCAEVRVGICVERSLDMMVALLGTLKAGGAYVPLDTTYPVERLAFMLKDAGVRVLLTQQRLLNLFDREVKAVCLDTDWEKIASSATENLPANANGQNAAYVIYTSGSTGNPKGVLIEHRSVVSYTETASAEYQLCAGDRVLQFASLSFDAAAEEIFPCLATGATLVLRTETMLSTVANFLAACREQSLTVLDLPTAYWHHLTSELAMGQLRLPETLRLVIIGGEKALPEQCAVWQQQAGPRVRLVNTYGPTEATIVATMCDLPVIAIDTESQQIVPIGSPVRSVQAYVLDRNLNPCPVGIPGELFIGGAGLARGYLHRPDLTAEKFIPNPFAHLPGSRLYRTGDLARFLPTGQLHFLGRSDHQVKVRGFRVELGEIEALLSTHPAVDEVVVMAREQPGGEKRLVAYVVSRAETEPSVSELRRHLQELLPDYMLPSAFVMLRELPITINGKVDRHALPEPSMMRPELDSSFIEARTPVEASVAEMWREVLKVERVGVEDNFFELGGHSLLATQVISRVRDAFAVELQLRRIFEYPTVTGLAACIETAMRDGQSVTMPAIGLVSRDEPLPLSFAQQRLWFLDQLSPDSAFYNLPAAVRLRGQLDVTALEMAFTEVVRRHESLRTTFDPGDGQPVQIISAPMPVTLPLVDFSELPDEERESAARSFVSTEAQQPFDLARGPLLRIKLMRLEAADHILTMTMHHIISDGWSMGVVIRELAALYVAHVAGEESPLPELSLQYADYAAWQREWLSGEVLDAQLAYWKQQLAGAPPLLALPVDRARPAMQTYNGAQEGFRFSKELTEKLETLSQREGVTLFMTLLAGFQCLLALYTGQGDIVVGSPIANRDRGEIESLIGFFANTLVLRTQFDGNPSFRELLKRVKETALGAYTHPDVPFEKLVEELQPARSLSHAPLFQVLFVLQNAPRATVELPGLQLSAMGGASGTAKFELLLNMTNTADGLMGSLEYNTDLFDAATIKRMRRHFEQLLEAIIAKPTQPLFAIPLLTEAERELRAEWNSTESDYPADACLHQLFERQADVTPSATALVFQDERLTYRALNERANQLAHHLRERGVSPEVLCGVFMERSTEMVVSLLAILKAGGAYVPLDPLYPQERLSFMLEDTRAAVLLTEQSLIERLPPSGAHIICLDGERDEISRHSDESPSSLVNSSNLAYVIYTSGSTGRPKGVAIEHHSTAAFIAWLQSIFSAEQMSGVLASTSICFDLSIFELFGTLSSGGTVILAENALHIAQMAGADQLTLINTVPSVMGELLRMEALPESVRTINLAGEALSNTLVQRIYEREHVEGVYNLYGPSEDTTYSTYALVQKGSDKTPAIGRPVSNTRVHLLNTEMTEVPIGVSGELYIAGAGLARGYLGRPRLTAERFVPDPFAHEPGGRLYRTGDVARYLLDGNLEYLGRADEQVKVRGFRIELGEIESVLAQYPGMHEAVVVAREDEEGAKRLIAYLTVEGEAEPSIQDLRSFLQVRLPEYMMPSAFMLLAEMPLTQTGKVNRRALPVPDTLRPDLAEAYTAARTPDEEVLTEIWCDVLGLERVGIHDNFFQLGGHSLLATQVISRVRARFEVELPLRRLFEVPTIATLSEEIVKARSVPATAQAPAIVPISRAARRMKRSSLET
jgi:amino acid adenylation domain-containing protein